MNAHFLFYSSWGKPLLCGSVRSSIRAPLEVSTSTPGTPWETRLEAGLSFYCKRSNVTAKIDRLTEPPTRGAWKDWSVCAGGHGGWGARGERGVPGTPKG